MTSLHGKSTNEEGGVSSSYAAFISYSRPVDGKLAPALQSGLQQFAKPWWRIRAVRVFRDQANLTANPGLWSSIREGLAQSEHFILLASPEAAISKWVRREVKYWLDNKAPENILIAPTDGELVWDEVAGDFAWAENRRPTTTCLPRCLKGVFREEPRFVDLRWVRSEEQISPRDPRFRECLADLAARLHHKPKDDLIGADVRLYRRVRTAMVAGVSILIAAIVAVLVAVQRQSVAVASEQGRQLILFEQGLRSDVAASLRAALRSYRLRKNSAAEAAVRTALEADTARRVLRASHSGLVASEFDSAGLMILTGSLDGSAKLFDAQTGRRVLAFGASSAQGSPLTGASFSGDRSMVVTAATDGKVDVYATSSGRRLATLIDYGAPALARWGTLRGRSVVFTSSPGGSPALWDPTKPSRPIARFATHPVQSGVDLSRDGRYIVTVRPDTVAEVWDVARGRLVASSPRLGAAALQVRFVTPTADRVAAITATGDSSWRVAFWDWRGPGGLQTTTWRGRQASELAVSWDGRRVAVGLDRRAVVLDAFTGRAVGGTPEEADWIKMVDFSPDGRWVVTAGNDGSARVWAATRWSRRPVGDLLGHVGAVSTARFHPRKQGVVVTAGIDGTARTWQFPLPTLLSRTGASSRMVDMALSRDGRYIVTAEDDGWLRVWRSDTGALQAEHRQKYAVNACFADPCKSSVTFTPDGMQVFTTSISGSRPVLWSWRGNQAPRLLEGSRFLVDSRLLITQAAVSPDKQSVAAGTRMNQVVVWDLGTGKITARLRAGRPEYVVSDVAFVPGTRLIAAGGTDGAVSIWDPRQSDRPLRSLGLGKPRPGVRALDVTRDGRYLVAATEDDTVRVWGISDGRLEQTIAGPWSRIGEVAFSPDGSLLAVGAADGWVHVWSWRDATNLATLRRHGDVVNSVGFTGDGAALVSASDDSTIAAYACTTCGPIDQVVRAAEQREKMNTPSR